MTMREKFYIDVLCSVFCLLVIKQAEKLKSREIKEGWMKNDEVWIKNDEGWMQNDEWWWFQAVKLRGFRTN